MNTLGILLQAPGGGMGSMNGIIMMVAIIAIFYFFMIRPQQKRQKEIVKAREAMVPGDKIVTAGGIYGKIKEIGDVYMIIEIADGVKIRVDKSQIYKAMDEVQQK